MKVVFRESFSKDLDKLKDKPLKEKIASVIEEIEAAKTFQPVRNFKKLVGYKNYYRIRVGDYRMGIYDAGNCWELVRILNRKDFYKYFP